MRISRKVIPMVLAAAISSPVLLTGCAGGQVYDGYDHGYVQWRAEAPYYSQWEYETHRRHERFERRNREEQQEYWQWRHDHGDHDHGEHGHGDHDHR